MLAENLPKMKFRRPSITALVGVLTSDYQDMMSLIPLIDMFLPGDPEIRESVGGRLGFDLLHANSPMMDFKAMEEIAGPDDVEALLVLKQVNARKPLVGLYGALDSLQGDIIGGYVARLTRGSIGLSVATL